MSEIITCPKERCLACNNTQIFIFKGTAECECMISEVKASDNLRKIVEKWTGATVPRMVKDILANIKKTEGYGIKFINGRDQDLEYEMTNAVKYLFQSRDFKAWEYLDVGCGTCLPAIKISEILGVYPLGIDYTFRRSWDSETGEFQVVNIGEFPYGDEYFRLISMCDILHHVPNPEQLLSDAIDALIPRGYILIIDHDCESWEDSYYLDLIHLAFSKATTEYLPTYGYRSRKYWRKFMSNFDVVYEKECSGYKTYIDVYRRR